MSEEAAAEEIIPCDYTSTVSGWPARYQPEWFADKTVDEEGVFIAVYTDLRLIARHLLSQEFAQPSIQATELVNEAFIKLLQNPAQSQSKRHLLNILARYMRQVLVDRGRRRRSLKRDADLTELHTHVGKQLADPDWLVFDQALDRLQQSKPVLYEVFQLHYFAGIQLNEIADTLECSERTVKRYWMAARLWVTEQISRLQS